MSSNLIPIKTCMDKMLELLRFVDETCAENGLEYWLDGGTLLGAVRHGGFIPWDDDLDICLLTDDFIKLIAILKEKCTHHDNFICFNSSRPATYWSEYIGDVSILKDGLIPVQIDIVPVKSIANNEEAIRVDKSIANTAYFFRQGKFKHPEDVIKEHESYLPQKNKEALQKKAAFYDFFLNDYYKNHAKREVSHGFTYVYNDMLVKKDRPYYQYDDIFPLQKIEFEGHSFSCPNNLKNYLTILYGENYITPPPKSQQVPYIFQNIKNELPKQRIENRLKIHFERDNKQFIARSSKTTMGRLINKFLSFSVLTWNCIKHREFKFIFIYLKYTLIQAR